MEDEVYFPVTVNWDRYPVCDVPVSQRSGFECRVKTLCHTEFLSSYHCKQLKSWQQQTIDLLEQQDDRKILWVYGHIGGSGKSFLTRYLVDARDAVWFEHGKKTVVQRRYQQEPIVVVSYERDGRSKIDYSVLENLKDGLLVTARSCPKTFRPPKVLCLAYSPPNISKLAADRWDIWRINECDTSDGMTCRTDALLNKSAAASSDEHC